MATDELQTEQAGVGPVCQTKVNLEPLSVKPSKEETEFPRTQIRTIYVCQLFAYLQTNKASSPLHQV